MLVALRVALRSTLAIWGMILILLAIPIAFDVGGENAGLAFSFGLSVFFFVVSTLRLLVQRTRLYHVATLLYYLQFALVPGMLLVHLSLWPGPHPEIITRILDPWRSLMAHSTGLFAILEGFCTLIVIQHAGRISRRWAARSDLFSLVLLALCSVLITLDLWLLVRVYAFPQVVGVATATLIGAALTLTLGLGVWGIWSRRGSVLESTLLFSYIVYVIYLTFTDFRSSNVHSSLFPFGGNDINASPSGGLVARPHPLLSFLGVWTEPQHLPSNVASTSKHVLSENPVLPPVIIDGYVKLMTTLAELTPHGVRTMLHFLQAATAAITPSVLVSLVVRLASFYFALRVVPMIPSTTASGIHEPPIRRRGRRFVLLYTHAPILIIAVYTHLLMQHFGGLVVPISGDYGPFEWSLIWSNSRQAWQFWGWADVFTTLAVYALELSAGAAE